MIWVISDSTCLLQFLQWVIIPESWIIHTLPWWIVVTSTFAMLWPIAPSCQNWDQNCIPMAQKRYLWYTNLILITPERSIDLIIGLVLADSPFPQNFAFLWAPHGLQEALVIHQPGLDDLGDVWNFSQTCRHMSCINHESFSLLGPANSEEFTD